MLSVLTANSPFSCYWHSFPFLLSDIWPQAHIYITGHEWYLQPISWKQFSSTVYTYYTKVSQMTVSFLERFTFETAFPGTHSLRCTQFQTPQAQTSAQLANHAVKWMSMTDYPVRKVTENSWMQPCTVQHQPSDKQFWRSIQASVVWACQMAEVDDNSHLKYFGSVSNSNELKATVGWWH